jgi:hypothetical protein
LKVINLFGGPGTGKSTTAAGIFNRMKVQGYNVELVTEYAKDMTWEGRDNVLADQLYILAKQHRRLERLQGKVDWAVVDSPFILGLIYAPENYFKHFEPLVMEMWDSYENINFMLERSFEYQPIGRLGTESAAKSIDTQLDAFLARHNITGQHIGIEEFNTDVVTKIVELATGGLNSGT